MNRILVFFTLLSLPLLGYSPGKWSHKDTYLFKKHKTGPNKEIVRNSEGQVVYVAEYEYNEDGKMTQEIYSDKEGKGDGKTIFRYTDGILSSEEIYDQTGTLIEKKTFQYKGNVLRKMVVKSSSGHEEITYTLQTDTDGNVISGEGRAPGSKEIEAFKFTQDPKKTNIQIQNLLDDKGRSLGEVRFKYDGKGNLVEREFLQGSVHRIHKLKYRSDGNLESHSFHVKQGENWLLEKTHVLVYSEENKGKVSKRED
ncbi:hypothetical protein P3G55_13495 [Leptospira sp. 96542]|nr:hypothetical protein [Leptospira sp. 96542]